MSGIASVRPSLSSGMDLLVRREGIRFHNEDAKHVRIEVEVENHGFTSSEPAELRLESAPFGAFVRWRPLARLVVPPIPPGGSRVVTAAAVQPRPLPLGGFANLAPAGWAPEPLVPPEGLRARRAHARAPGGQLALLLVNLILGGQASPRSTMGHLPPDLLDLLDDPRPHWAGNLNVWIARRAVERHLAPRLRIQPARANLALFCLGDGHDTYAFRIERPGAAAGEDWNIQLHDLQHELPMVWRAHREDPPRWYSIDGPSPVLLAFRPPAGAGAGKLELHVTQRSTGEVALVEFDLDPAAAGPGCFIL